MSLFQNPRPEGEREKVIRIIERITDTKHGDWLGSGREQYVVFARQMMAMYLYDYEELPMYMVGRYFGRTERFARYLVMKDHTEVRTNVEYRRLRKAFAYYLAKEE